MIKELSKGFTGIEINGVRFSNISEMLQYMGKQRERIAELEKSCDETQELLAKQIEATYKLDKENAELEKENTKLKEFVNAPHTKGRKTTRGDYIKTVWDLSKQLTKAKEHIENLLYYVKQCTCERSNYAEIEKDIKEAEQFLSCKEILNN